MPSFRIFRLGIYRATRSLSKLPAIRDPILKEHLKWLGLFLFLLFLVNTVLSRDFLAFRIADEALLAIDAYFLYRAVKSLAPMSRTPLASNLEPAA